MYKENLLTDKLAGAEALKSTCNSSVFCYLTTSSSAPNPSIGND